MFGLTRLGIESGFTVSIADALSMHALNGKISPEKNSRNVDLADSTTKHQYSFSEFIVSKQLVFGHLISQIACYQNRMFKFYQKIETAFSMSAACSLEEDIQNSILEPVK